MQTDRQTDRQTFSVNVCLSEMECGLIHFSISLSFSPSANRKQEDVTSGTECSNPSFFNRHTNGRVDLSNLLLSFPAIRNAEVNVLTKRRGGRGGGEENSRTDIWRICPDRTLDRSHAQEALGKDILRQSK